MTYIAFGAYFLYDFSTKIFLVLILRELTRFECHTFFGFKILNKMHEALII